MSWLQDVGVVFEELAVKPAAGMLPWTDSVSKTPLSLEEVRQHHGTASLEVVLCQHGSDTWWTQITQLPLPAGPRSRHGFTAFYGDHYFFHHQLRHVLFPRREAPSRNDFGCTGLESAVLGWGHMEVQNERLCGWC